MSYEKKTMIAESGDSLFLSENINLENTSEVQEHSVSNEVHSHPLAQEDIKHFLRELNKRLAAYIDKVRELETENKRLECEYHKREIKLFEIEASRKNESNSIKDGLRKQLDEDNIARIRADTVAKKFERELVELRKKIERHEVELAAVVEDRDQLQDRLERARNELNLAESRCLKAQNEVNESKRDMAILSKKQAILLRRIGEESASRIEIESLIKPELNAYNMLLQTEEQRNSLIESSTRASLMPRPKTAVNNQAPNARPFKRRRLVREEKLESL